MRKGIPTLPLQTWNDDKTGMGISHCIEFGKQTKTRRAPPSSLHQNGNGLAPSPCVLQGSNYPHLSILSSLSPTSLNEGRGKVVVWFKVGLGVYMCWLVLGAKSKEGDGSG